MHGRLDRQILDGYCRAVRNGFSKVSSPTAMRPRQDRLRCAPLATLRESSRRREQTDRARAMAAGALRRAPRSANCRRSDRHRRSRRCGGRASLSEPVWLSWATRPRGGKIRVGTQLKHFRGDRETVRRKTVLGRAGEACSRGELTSIAGSELRLFYALWPDRETSGSQFADAACSRIVLRKRGGRLVPCREIIT